MKLLVLFLSLVSFGQTITLRNPDILGLRFNSVNYEKYILNSAIEPAALLRSNDSPRLSINGSFFVTGKGEVVKLMGANYVVKARPYFPSLEEVRQDAKDIKAALGGISGVRPVIRLATMMEGFMPRDATADLKWMMQMEKVVQIFNKEGVYILLDSHTDAMTTTNCGQGLPAWMAKYMQDHNNPDNDWYYVSPTQPYEYINKVFDILLGFGGVPSPSKITSDANEWYNFSFDDTTHGPEAARFMNIGNKNCRLLNNDDTFIKGSMYFSKQLNNFAYRFYSLGTTTDQGDIENLYTPYLTFVKYLSSVWNAHSNVIAVELLNEPPMAGYDSFRKVFKTRRNLFDLYAKVISDLGDKYTAPIAFEDVVGSLPGGGKLLTFISSWFVGGTLSDNAMKVLQNRAKKNQLMLALHYYALSPMVADVSLEVMIGKVAKSQADLYHPDKDVSIPIFLSEFSADDPVTSDQDMANTIVTAIEHGAAGATYWHYKNFYSPLSLFGNHSVLNEKIWPEYVDSILNGTSYGAQINGARGGTAKPLFILGDKYRK